MTITEHRPKIDPALALRGRLNRVGSVRPDSLHLCRVVPLFSGPLSGISKLQHRGGYCIFVISTYHYSHT